jgi:hypothetical protein
MRLLSYAILGIILGYAYPILSMYIEFGLKKSLEGIIWVASKLV